METYIFTILIFVEDQTVYQKTIDSFVKYLKIADYSTYKISWSQMPTIPFFDKITTDSAEIKGYYYVFDPLRRDEDAYKILSDLLYKTPGDYKYTICIDQSETTCDTHITADKVIPQLHKFLLKHIKFNVVS